MQVDHNAGAAVLNRQGGKSGHASRVEMVYVSTGRDMTHHFKPAG